MSWLGTLRRPDCRYRRAYTRTNFIAGACPRVSKNVSLRRFPRKDRASAVFRRRDRPLNNDGPSCKQRSTGTDVPFRHLLVISSLLAAISLKEGMGDDIVANGNSKRISVDAGCSKVYASEHARVLHFFESG